MPKTSRLLISGFVLFTLILSLIAFPFPASAQKGPDFAPGRYIVVLADDASPIEVARDHNLVPEFAYNVAITGFAGPISPMAIASLQDDPRVKYIEKDQKVFAFAQTNPTGIERVDAEPVDSSNLGSAVTIAIIDTGIDLDHPDLNVVQSTNCAKGGPFGGNCKDGGGDDDNGHGTHVAGTAAALNNNAGVVGVAAGADLWAVKVLDKSGSGWMSWIIGGIDYVTANADQIDVANMSLGCECESNALDSAIANSVAAGVTYVVAAGNSDKDASTFSPANHQDVVTVSAIADSDGKCGGQGSSTNYGADDTFASFSNYGDAVDIAAPGVSIYSTHMNGGYATYSGTSMASPHVAGAAAILIVSDSSLTPAQVRDALITNGVSQGQSCADLNSGFGGFSGDPDSLAEPLVYVGNTSVGDLPAVTITKPADDSTFNVGDSIEFTGSASDTEDGDLTTSLVWTSNLDGQIGTSGSFTTTLSDGTHTVTASVTDSDKNTASASITVNVVNDAPVVTITSPTDGSTFDSGATILFEGNASDTEDGDLTASLTWTSSIDGQFGTGGSFSTTLTDGDHTITAKVTDSGGKTSSSSIKITVGTPPATGTTSTVDSITYSTTAGKNNDKHLIISIHVTDDLGNDVSGASVSIDLYRDDNLVGSATATTGSTGNVNFSLKNASSGTYTTTITDVTASGLNWDGITPSNSFEKLSSSTRNQNSILTN